MFPRRSTKAAKDVPVINISVSTAMDALRPCPFEPVPCPWLSIEFGLDLRFALAPQSPVRPSRRGLAHPWVVWGTDFAVWAQLPRIPRSATAYPFPRRGPIMHTKVNDVQEISKPSFLAFLGLRDHPFLGCRPFMSSGRTYFDSLSPGF